LLALSDASFFLEGIEVIFTFFRVLRSQDVYKTVFLEFPIAPALITIFLISVMFTGSAPDHPSYFYIMGFVHRGDSEMPAPSGGESASM